MNEALAQALAYLRAGGIVAGPTESVYGLFASAFDRRATERVLALKGRRSDQPLPLVVGDLGAVRQVAVPPPDAEAVMEALWPGPLTLVLPAAPGLPRAVTAGTGTVGLRIPAHRVARALAQGAGPLTATSANRSGQAPVLEAADLDAALRSAPDLFVLEGVCGGQRPSTVARLTESGVEILRPGPVSEAQIRAALARGSVDPEEAAG